jgi:hypothetical protein
MRIDSPVITGTTTTPTIKITTDAIIGKVWGCSGTDGEGAWATGGGGVSNADGGFSNSVYSAAQLIDGGGA